MTQALTHLTPAGRWLIAYAWTAFLVIVLVQAGDDPVIPIVPDGPHTLLREIFFTLVHFVSFGLTMILWCWTLRPAFGHQRALTISLILALVLAVITELAQDAQPGRHAQWHDLLANISGVACAAWWTLRQKTASVFGAHHP